MVAAVRQVLGLVAAAAVLHLGLLMSSRVNCSQVLPLGLLADRLLLGRYFLQREVQVNLARLPEVGVRGLHLLHCAVP